MGGTREARKPADPTLGYPNISDIKYIRCVGAAGGTKNATQNITKVQATLYAGKTDSSQLMLTWLIYCSLHTLMPLGAIRLKMAVQQPTYQSIRCWCG